MSQTVSGNEMLVSKASLTFYTDAKNVCFKLRWMLPTAQWPERVKQEIVSSTQGVASSLWGFSVV